MSNSGIIQLKNNSQYGIYLHWNGDRDSVEAFLQYCKLKGYSSNNYCRLIQVISNYFGGDNSIYLEDVNSIHADNGIYVIDNWKIVHRKNGHSEQNEHDINEMLLEIDKAQPLELQLGKKFLSSEIVSTSDLRIGDKVFKYNNLSCIYEECEVVGIGVNEYQNGTNVLNIPYVNKYGNCGRGYMDNINNYILDKEIRVIK